MSPAGDADLPVRTRAALLDALEALEDQREAVVVIGAQALYLHTGEADVALAEETKDSDLALDRRLLRDDPLIEEAMSRAGFTMDLESPQPGTWLNKDGIPVDLMVPDALADEGGRRGARIPPHSSRATRRAVGLEGAVVDNSRVEIRSLMLNDDRVQTVKVAGPAALLVAKLHKIGERAEGDGERLEDKDAHDIYRLLVAIDTEVVAEGLLRLQADPLAGSVTETAIAHLAELFAAGAEAQGSLMAGRAEEGIGDPLVVAASVAALAGDLLDAIESG